MLAIFAISISVWIVANYISNDIELQPITAIRANYFVFLFSFAATLALLRFSIVLAKDVRSRQIFNIFFPAMCAIGVMAATPLVVAGVALQGEVYAVEFGPGIAVYGICLLSIILATFIVIYKNYRKSVGRLRAKLRVLLNALSYAMPGVVLMQFILPTTTGWFGLTNIGVLPMLILVFGLYYGVVKHKMFDLSFYVVRAALYILSILLLAVLYVAPILYVTVNIIFGVPFEFSKFIFGVTVSTIAAMNFDRFKLLFNRLTRKIFFRDEYDSASLLGEINSVLVTTTNLDIMLSKCAELISNNLKSDYCSFVLSGSEDLSARVISDKNKQFSNSEMKKLFKTLSVKGAKTVITDYLDDDGDIAKPLLQRNDIGMVINLTADNTGNSYQLGYVLLGFKRSGNIYNKQDKLTLETTADVIIIAIQNALRFEEIQNFNITLQQRVETATMKLRRTNAKLEALDESKDDFISMASHQLRTPLTAVKGYLSMVLEGDAGGINPVQKKMLNQAFMSSQRMVFLIADLLNVSRLKTGKFVIEAVPINLANLVHEELGQLRETAAVRGVKLSFKGPKSFPDLMLDETKTRQVVMNFVDNAIHYTPAGGKIDIELTEKPHSIELLVKDNGIGVPKSEQHHLFTKFYRAGNARRERPDGTGLGLFMAKKVVVAQGGAVIFTSKENQGSVFGFTMPKEKLLIPAQK